MKIVRAHALISIVAICVVIAACGKSNEPYTGGKSAKERGWKGFVAAWSTTNFNDAELVYLSKDGQSAYFIAQKLIGPEGGAWGQGWRSPEFIGRIDGGTGVIDTRPFPQGQNIAVRPFVMDSPLIEAVRADSDMRRIRAYISYHGYGDGRYLLYSGNTLDSPSERRTYISDLEKNTYWLAFRGAREAYVSADEKSAIFISEAGDTWIYDIVVRTSRKITESEALPLFYRGFHDLPDETQQRIRNAIAEFTHGKIYREFPEHEKL